jgi:hypothetical protein
LPTKVTNIELMYLMDVVEMFREARFPEHEEKKP